MCRGLLRFGHFFAELTGPPRKEEEEEEKVGGGEGGGSLFPFKIFLCFLVPEITSKLVLSFLISKMVYVLLLPEIFCLCSPYYLFPLISHVPNPWEILNRQRPNFILRGNEIALG